MEAACLKVKLVTPQDLILLNSLIIREGFKFVYETHNWVPGGIKEVF